MLKRFLAKKKVTNVGVAELKIFAILIVLMAFTVTGMVTYMIADTKINVEGFVFVTCVGGGGSDCSQMTEKINIIRKALPATFTLLSLVPVAVILFTCDVQALKKWPKL